MRARVKTYSIRGKEIFVSMRRTSWIEFVAATWAIIRRLVLPVGHRHAARST